MEFNDLISAIENGEDFLLKRLYDYASDAEYTKYTSTKEDDWRMTLRKPSEALINFMKANNQPDTIHVDEEFEKNPIAKFGVLEAKKHRERGVEFTMFLGLTKLVRQAFIDLIYESNLSNDLLKLSLAITHRYFDKFELGFSSEWVRYQNEDLIKDLQNKNRTITNEKNSYLTIFQSITEASFVVNKKMQIIEFNQAFVEFIDKKQSDIKGKNWTEIFDADFIKELPLINTIKNATSFTGIECKLLVKDEIKTVLVGGSFLNDISGKNAGGVCVIKDITIRKNAENELNKHRHQLEENVKKRTKELNIKNIDLIEKNKKLEKYHELFVGREFRIKELRDKVKELEKRIEN
jgi:PAS domain S-box-containing protein